MVVTFYNPIASVGVIHCFTAVISAVSTFAGSVTLLSADTVLTPDLLLSVLLFPKSTPPTSPWRFTAFIFLRSRLCRSLSCASSVITFVSTITVVSIATACFRCQLCRHHLFPYHLISCYHSGRLWFLSRLLFQVLHAGLRRDLLPSGFASVLALVAYTVYCHQRLLRSARMPEQRRETMPVLC